MLDLLQTRTRFPALAEVGPTGQPLVHADAPGGTQAVDAAIDAMAEHLRTGTSNTHGPFAVSQRVDRLVDRVRDQLGGFLGSEPESVVFGPNMTTLTMHLARALTPRFGPDDAIACTRLDHDANVAPWLTLAERTGATVRMIEFDPATGRLDPDSLDQAVRDDTRLVTFPGASNALGTVVDPAPLVSAAHAVGAWTFMDAVHLAPHAAIDRRALGVDVVACSAYKFFGPHAGVMLADPALLADLTPERLRPAPQQGPDGWQTGTANFEAIAGIGGAIDYLDDVGIDRVAAHEAALSERLLSGVEPLRHVRLYGPPEPVQRTPTFAVTIERVEPAVAAETFAAAGINVWHGHYYAVEPMRALGLLDAGGAVRIGFVHYHGDDDVDRVLEVLADFAR